MNAEDFMNYAVLAIITVAAGAYIAWDAWMDRQAERRDADCCPPGYGCDKCYYGVGK